MRVSNQAFQPTFWLRLDNRILDQARTVPFRSFEDLILSLSYRGWAWLFKIMKTKAFGCIWRDRLRRSKSCVCRIRCLTTSKRYSTSTLLRVTVSSPLLPNLSDQTRICKIWKLCQGTNLRMIWLFLASSWWRTSWKRQRSRLSPLWTNAISELSWLQVIILWRPYLLAVHAIFWKTERQSILVTLEKITKLFGRIQNYWFSKTKTLMW